MCSWVDVAKRKFFAALLLLIVVEVFVVVLIARSEHDRFPPVPLPRNDRIRVGKLRVALVSHTADTMQRTT